ncbi:MAG: UDP-N-acetylmuramoyl-L-alanyl-D-glutamate--2,6-diaminopimelate ligase [Pseudomonadota bacterium]
MTLNDLFGNARNVPAATVTGITADSRKVRPGFVFAAIAGVAADGLDFVPQAVAAGAVAILTDRPVETGEAALVRVDDVRSALSVAAARYYAGAPATVAAITGTNGKSSSVDFLRQIWASLGEPAASLGTLGAIAPGGTIDLGHTTPDPVAIHETLSFLARQGVSHLAMEASSHGLEQRRMDSVNLAAVAFTNFTQDHLDYHPTMDAYLEAKRRLFRELARKGIPAVVNADSPYCEAFESAAVEAGLRIVSVGWRGRDLKLAELMPRATGQSLLLKWRGEEHKVDLPLIGEFQAINALTAAGVALSLNDDFSSVADALSKLEPVKGRLEFVGETAGGGAIFVDYAHTPDGLDTLLRAARPHTAGRLVVVFGCGGDRDALKRPLMGEVAARQADAVIITDDNPRSEDPEAIRNAILRGAPDATTIGDRAEAIAAGIAQLQPGDTLLIAGKGHETGQIVGGEIIPFSDQSEVQNALKEVARV